MSRQIKDADAVIHAAELENRSDYAPALSSFLTPSEQAVLWRTARYPHRLFFWGGFTGAERRAAVFLPEWAAEGAPYGGSVRWDSPDREAHLRGLIFGDDAPFPDITEEIVLLRVCGSSHRELSHRDVLGSLMGLGITRQSAGDICMLSPYEAALAVSGKLSAYICESLTKVGSDGVRVFPDAAPAEFVFERKFEELSVTASSMRLDCVVSAVTGLSRTRTAEHIAAGLVQISGIVSEDTSDTVAAGDTVTVRGYGKYLIGESGGLTRKSRIRLTVKRYV